MPYLKIILLAIVQIAIFASYLPGMIKTLIDGKGEKLVPIKLITDTVIINCFIVYGVMVYDQIIILTFATSGTLLILNTLIMLKYR